MNKYILIEFLTTSLLTTSEITSVQAIKLENGVIKERFSSLVKCTETIPQIITEITGISDMLLSEKGKAAADVLNELYDFCQGNTLIGVYMNFQILVLNNACLQNNLPVFVNQTIDLSQLIKSRFGKQHTVKRAAEKLGFDISIDDTPFSLYIRISLYLCFQHIKSLFIFTYFINIWI